MQNNSDENFENKLQDILAPDDPQSPSRSSFKESEGKPAIQKPVFQTPPLSRKYPLWLETLVRIIAAIAAVTLLILFSLQITGR